MESGFLAAIFLVAITFLMPGFSRELRKSWAIIFAYWIVIALHQVVAFLNQFYTLLESSAQLVRGLMPTRVSIILQIRCFHVEPCDVFYNPGQPGRHILSPHQSGWCF